MHRSEQAPHSERPHPHHRGHHHPRGHAKETGEPGGHRGHHFGGEHPRGGRGGHGGHGGPVRGRARRGEARYLLLDVLQESPKHGYMIIRALEEKSGGKYVPSPGTIYPTLQMLEDLGFVRPQADDERRVYHITEAGTAELQAHAAEVAEFWQRFQNDGGSRAAQAEQNFLTTEVEELARTVEAGFRTAAASDDLATIVKIREEIERCKNRVRAIIAGHDS